MTQLQAKEYGFECKIIKEDDHFVYIKTLTGKTLVILTYPEMTIGDLKEVFFGIEGIPAD